MAAVSSRYARAFTDVVFSHKLDAVKTVQDLEAVVALLKSSEDLRNVWASPSIPAQQKLKLLDAMAVQAGLSKQLRNFVAVLITQRRVNLVEEIAQLFRAELNERMGFAEAEITSSRELAPDERANLESQIAKLTGKTVKASYKRDVNIMGGAVIKVGSTIYDGSVRGQLQKLKQQMMS
jgi:F-type H+-transporting ATPase subunit delta